MLFVHIIFLATVARGKTTSREGREKAEKERRGAVK
jgi:hypothetical protein